MKRTSQISTYAISVTSTKFLEVLELVALGISPSGIRGIRLHFEKVNFAGLLAFIPVFERQLFARLPMSNTLCAELVRSEVL